jgi:hypothetical protein
MAFIMLDLGLIFPREFSEVARANPRLQTHVQAGIGGTRLGILDTAKNVFSKGGVKGLFNGLTAIAMGAGS